MATRSNSGASVTTHISKKWSLPESQGGAEDDLSASGRVFAHQWGDVTMTPSILSIDSRWFKQAEGATWKNSTFKKKHHWHVLMKLRQTRTSPIFEGNEGQLLVNLCFEDIVSPSPHYHCYAIHLVRSVHTVCSREPSSSSSSSRFF